QPAGRRAARHRRPHPEARAMTPVLAVDGLTLSVMGETVVSNLSFAIGPGERLGLIGESGSGKTLTAMAAVGLLPRPIVARGAARLGGVEVIGAPERALNR